MCKPINVFLLAVCCIFLMSTNSLASENSISLTNLYTDNKDSIVSVIVSGQKEVHTGTGFFYNNEGYILTAGHIFEGLSPNAKIIVKTLADQREHPAKLVYHEYINKLTIHDIALLKIDSNAYQSLTIGSSDEIEIGEQVATIGNPNKLEQTLSSGIISCVRLPQDLHKPGETDKRYLDGKIIQTTVPIYNGNSGGPLFNSQGEVIGVVQSFDTRIQWISWMIPIGDINKIIRPHIE